MGKLIDDTQIGRNFARMRHLTQVSTGRRLDDHMRVDCL